MDNNPIVFVQQPDNGIPITSYYDAPEDTALREAWRFLLGLESQRRRS
jgi:TFIIF-interacting CTD phosphatase-like protein